MLTMVVGMDHANGMLQYAGKFAPNLRINSPVLVYADDKGLVVWTMLSAEGLGCNLQHYNPMVSARTSEQWNIPTTWLLKAQMVFGTPAGPPIQEKVFEPVEKRMVTYGA
jgi:predicted oxidoreductase (fatty acid repression mutant protein)